MIFRQLFDRESSTFTYLVACARTREAMLLDPVLSRIDDYARLLSELDLRLTVAADTHVHADHITALGELRRITGCASVLGEEAHVACASRTVVDGGPLVVGDLVLRALYTPGHTDDSYCFLLPDRVFTGDTLLIRGTGRTDFQNGDPVAQYRSLFEVLLRLPGETLVFPAHDYRGWTVSTIAEERAWNPRLQVSGVDEYAALMRSLNLPRPMLMDIAVEANRACGQTEPVP